MTASTLPRMRANSEGTQDGPPPVLGLEEAANLLGMLKGSLMTIRGKAGMARRSGSRDANLFPEPDWVISGNPVWKPSTIRQWARRTGRIDESGNAVPGKSGPKSARR